MFPIATLRARPQINISSRTLAPVWGRLAAILVLLVLPVLSAAQQVSDDMLQKASQATGLTKEQLKQMYQQGGASTTPSAPQDTTNIKPPGKTELPPSTPTPPESLPPTVAPKPPVVPPPTGPILFGANFFRLTPGMFTQSSFGPVPDDYVVGVGDEVVVDVWGDVEFRLERVVDRDGSIIIPKAGKISCAGMTLEQLRHAVRARLSTVYSGISLDPDKGTTFLDVTLGTLRPIRVFVIGDAVQPGAYDLTSLATIFTGLYAAGGPSESGSMRDIRLIRGDQTLAHFDLYDYLLNGRRQNDLILREYDTILIPPRGITVRLTGELRRPFRFEMKDGETLSDLLRFGGGFTATAASDILHILRIVPPQDRRLGMPDRVQVDVPMKPGTYEPARPEQGGICAGDSVYVNTISTRLGDWVEISGPVKQPGRYAYRQGMDVRALVETAGKAYPELLADRGLIDRISPDSSYQSFHFPANDVLAGRGDPVPLQPMDRVRLFSKWDMQSRPTVSISGAIRKAVEVDFREGMTLYDLILDAGGLTESADSLEASVSRLRWSAASSHDEQHQPDRTWDVIRVRLGADVLRSGQGIPLEAHDAVVVRKLPWWEPRSSVVLQGEVLYPGVYTLLHPDERLSELITRAGGLKPGAFMPGVRVTRTTDHVGNISVDMNCALDHPDRSCNLILVNGDTVSIPQTISTVKVIGAVGNPTSLVYESGKKPNYYIDRAGGFAEGANRWKTYVVYPNGSSEKVRRFWFDPQVQTGSVIVVPVSPPKEKKDELETIGKVTTILASLATVWLVASKVTP